MTRILISGAGVAGPSLAHWLTRNGFEATIVEKAEKFRTGGYIIDFWGVGYDVAERMNLLSELEKLAYHADEVRFVDQRGARITGFDASIFEENLTGRYFSILRGDLAETIYRNLDEAVETIFGDHIVALDESEDGIDATFSSGTKRRFDLVIGADGLHSAVRELTFGAESNYEKYLKYYVAAFSSSGFPHRSEGVYVSYCLPGRQIARFSLRDDKTVFFIIFASEKKLPHLSMTEEEKKALVIEKFPADSWECSEIFSAMKPADDFYFDSVSQIRMNQWSKGRVALIGDAAYCPSLLAGQGSAFAMAGAYILAGELKSAGGDYARAFQRYENLFKPFVSRKQDAAESLASWFAPRTEIGLTVRNIFTTFMQIPQVGAMVVRNMIDDSLSLPHYS